MRPFIWKIVICLTPTILSIAVCLIAFWNYSHEPMKIGDYQVLSGLNYKLGVDLVGGTILVYEIDETKKRSDYDKDKLVAALKRRLDPADLYNITIRPVSDTRIEIILPTGGRHRRDAEERAWNELLAKVQAEYSLPDGSLSKVKAGKETTLVGAVVDKTRPPEKEIRDAFAVYNAEKDEKKKEDEWKKAVAEVKAKYKLEKLDADTGEETQVVSTVMRNKKPTAEDVQKYIDDNWKGAGQKRDFTGDEVEQIKEKIQRVGSMEFAIVANAVDDPKAIDAAVKYLQSDNKANMDAIRAANKAGTPPPFPPNPDVQGGAWPVEQSVVKQSGDPTAYTYRWVEIGKEELHSLHLNNDAENDTTTSERTKTPKNSLWKAVERARNSPLDRGVYRLYGSLLLYTRTIDEGRRATLPEKDKSKRYEYYLLIRNTPDAEKLTGEYLIEAKDGQDNLGRLAVAFRFNTEGASRMYTLTSRNKPDGKDQNAFHRQMAIILDDQVMSAPNLNEPLHDSGQITGGGEKGFTRKDADQLINVLRAGALPASLKPQPVSENTMGATLGEDTIRSGTFSVGLAFIAVLIFMLVYYRTAGLIACTALLANLFLTVAFMAIVNATFTLPGLAGLVLMLAMAVDANVLIYERIREESERGASLSLSIRNGYDRAFATVIDTHMSSIFTAVVLYVVGNDQLKGFGISLAVGLIISLFTSLYMTRVMFDIGLAKRWITQIHMMKFLTKTNFHFMNYRKPVFIATVVTAVLGLFFFLIRGTEGLNMDFVGGTVYSCELNEVDASADSNKGKKSVSEMRDLIEKREKEGRLQLTADPTPVPGSDSRYTLTFKGEETPRTVTVLREKDKVVTPADVRRRIESFEISSVEAIYSSNSNISDNDRSRFYTIRTREKSRDLVETCLSRLIGDVLKQTALSGVSVDQVVVELPKEMTQEDARKALEKPLADQNVKIRTFAPTVAFTGDKKETKSYVISFESSVALADLTKAFDGISIPVGEKGEKKEKPIAKATTFGLELTDFAHATQVQPLMQSHLLHVGALTPTQNIKADARSTTLDADNRSKEFDVTLPDAVPLDQLQKAANGFKAEPRSQPIRLEIFDSQLAAETQARALYAILASWGAILCYLWFRFGNWTFGLAAVLCLVHDICMTLGMIVVAHWFHVLGIGWILGFSDFKLDLAAIASLLTLIGYSVNDTIVVFDRIREVRGKNPALTTEMINESINGTLSRTILTSVITLLTVLVLYIFGGEGVHLFSYIMVVGVILGTFSSIFVASPLLLILGEGRAPATPGKVPTPAPVPASPMPKPETGITKKP